MNNSAYQWDTLFARWDDILKQTPSSLDAPFATKGIVLANGASNHDIENVEQQFKIKLPNSYRSFLEFSNGCQLNGYDIHILYPAQEIGLFYDNNPDWVDCYLDAQLSENLRVADNLYFVYGAEQDTALIRPEYLTSVLQMSSVSWRYSNSVFLLNPEVIDERGEWEAWAFSDEKAGASRYRSFYELLLSELNVFETVIADINS